MTETSQDDGFTLVELLVTILIVGVLSAIAVPVYMQLRDRGYQAAMKTDLKNAVTAETAYTVTNGTYTVDVNALTDEGYRPTSGVTPVHVKLVGASFIACVKHQASSAWLVFDGTSGVTSTSSSDCA